MILQTIILFLKKDETLTISPQNKVEIMFKIHFLFSSMVFMNNVKEFLYLLSTDDDKSFTNYKTIKIIYKTNSNKIIRISKIINRTLYQFINIIIK